MTLTLFDAEHIAATEARDAEYHPTPGEVVRALLDGMAEAGLRRARHRRAPGVLARVGPR